MLVAKLTRNKHNGKRVSQTILASFSTQRVFDRSLKQRQRNFAQRLDNADYYDYLRNESAENILDRLEDITRSFPRALEIGSYRGGLLKSIESKPNFDGPGGIGGIEELVQCDWTALHMPEEVQSATSSDIETQDSTHLLIKSSNVAWGDIEKDAEDLPFNPASFDLVLSSLNMHWVNDLPLFLMQVKTILKPDGAFIGSLLGGNTLKELRYCFYLADMERKGGLGPHASPMAKTSDIAGLMQAAGFALPTVDVDTITVRF